MSRKPVSIGTAVVVGGPRDHAILVDLLDLVRHPAGVDDQALEVELGDRREGREVVLVDGVHDLHEGALPVEVLEDPVDLVGDLGESLDQLVIVDLEDRLERRQLLEHPPPLVDSPHALHEQALRGHFDGASVLGDRAELEIEGAVVPHQEAVDRLLTLEPTQLGVDERAVEKVDRALLLGVLEREHARFPADVDGLQEIDEPHLRERTCEAGLALATSLEPAALEALEHQVHPGDDLFDVDGLGEVILDPQLQPADLALHRALARQEHEGDVLPVGVLAQLLHQGEAIARGQAGVRQDQIGP